MCTYGHEAAAAANQDRMCTQIMQDTLPAKRPLCDQRQQTPIDEPESGCCVPAAYP
jgi:hypothetical protein